MSQSREDLWPFLCNSPENASPEVYKKPTIREHAATISSILWPNPLINFHPAFFYVLIQVIGSNWMLWTSGTSHMLHTALKVMNYMQILKVVMMEIFFSSAFA